jgi:hypothetical protein
MTFTSGPYPAPDQPLDNSDTYAHDYPFAVKQSVLTQRRHRWFQIYDIGTPTGPYSLTPGLNIGATQRIQFDHKPDVIIVSISGQTATTGRVNLYYGETGGPPIRLGPLGKAIIPSPEGGIITLVNVGTTATYGTVVAVAGMDTTPSVDIVCGG